MTKSKSILVELGLLKLRIRVELSELAQIVGPDQQNNGRSD